MESMKLSNKKSVILYAANQGENNEGDWLATLDYGNYVVEGWSSESEALAVAHCYEKMASVLKGTRQPIPDKQEGQDKVSEALVNSLSIIVKEGTFYGSHYFDAKDFIKKVLAHHEAVE